MSTILLTDQVFAERYTKEYFSIIEKIIEELPWNPVAILWKEMFDEKTDIVDIYYQKADELLQEGLVSFQDTQELKEAGFDI